MTSTGGAADERDSGAILASLGYDNNGDVPSACPPNDFAFPPAEFSSPLTIPQFSRQHPVIESTSCLRISVIRAFLPSHFRRSPTVGPSAAPDSAFCPSMPFRIPFITPPQRRK